MIQDNAQILRDIDTVVKGIMKAFSEKQDTRENTDSMMREINQFIEACRNAGKLPIMSGLQITAKWADPTKKYILEGFRLVRIGKSIEVKAKWVEYVEGSKVDANIRKGTGIH